MYRLRDRTRHTYTSSDASLEETSRYLSGFILDDFAVSLEVAKNEGDVARREAEDGHPPLVEPVLRLQRTGPRQAHSENTQ